MLLENAPVISITDLRMIVSEQLETSQRKEKIEKLKEKLNKIVENGNWELDDVFNDHNYCDKIDSTVFECIVYFLAG